MKPKLIVIFVLIVLMPLALLGWLGYRVAQNERDAVQTRMREVLLGRLRDIDADIRALLEDRERALLTEAAQLTNNFDHAATLTARSALVRQYLVVGPDGLLEYPTHEGPSSQQLAGFFDRTRQIWEHGDFPQSAVAWPQAAQAAPSQGKGGLKSVYPGRPQDGASSCQGWYVWYWGDGLNLIFWWCGRDGRILGAELNSARLAADVIAALPGGDELGDEARIVLRDSRGQPIYQWGGYSPVEGKQPIASLALAWPLASWTLEHYASPEFVGGGYGRGMMMNLTVGLALLAVAVVALAIYYYRESAREMREAAQRVTFVNQVSHELKTPLTNIRMYAELLQDDLDLHLPEQNGQVNRYLAVIVAESQRLSRLIGNVLTFSRKQRGALTLRAARANPDDVLRTVAARFEPALHAKGITIELNLRDPQTARLDADALEQIIGNLLSNVEKYAAGATRVKIASTRDGDTLGIVVEDDGAGIPPREAAKVFAAFYRVSNRLTDGVAGTGIGLSIARDLARLHGGDLTLERADKGARFSLKLHAPVEESE